MQSITSLVMKVDSAKFEKLELDGMPQADRQSAFKHYKSQPSRLPTDI